MSVGQFSSAWQINDCTGNHWPSAHRLWPTGRDKPGTIVVKSLHGLGDAVQMLQYALQLQSLAAHTHFHVPEVLRPLMTYFRGVECVMPHDSPLTNLRYQPPQIEMMELPYLFRTTVADLPLATNYLSLPSAVLNKYLLKIGRTAKPRIGLVWAGGEWDRERWIPLDLLRAMIRNNRFEWWSLQGGCQAEEARDLPLKRLLQVCGNGLEPLAAAIANLDLIITVDSLAVHLAGALGKPAWLMLKHDADWRWMERRNDSPWYPSLRLFRQTSPRDWNSVIVAVTQALQNYERSREDLLSPLDGSRTLLTM